MTVRIIELSTALAWPWDGLAWPSKASADDLPFGIDARRWLQDAGVQLLLAKVVHSPDLVVSAPSYDAGRTPVVVHIAGGEAGTNAFVRFQLYLSDGGLLNVAVILPVRADDAAPASDLQQVADPALASILTVNGEPLTAAGALISI